MGRGLGVDGKLSPKGDKQAVYCLEFGTARVMPTRGAPPYFELVIELEVAGQGIAAEAAPMLNAVEILKEDESVGSR